MRKGTTFVTKPFQQEKVLGHHNRYLGSIRSRGCGYCSNSRHLKMYWRRECDRLEFRLLLRLLVSLLLHKSNDSKTVLSTALLRNFSHLKSLDVNYWKLCKWWCSTIFSDVRKGRNKPWCVDCIYCRTARVSFRSCSNMSCSNYREPASTYRIFTHFLC